MGNQLMLKADLQVTQLGAAAGCLRSVVLAASAPAQLPSAVVTGISGICGLADFLFEADLDLPCHHTGAELHNLVYTAYSTNLLAEVYARHWD